ncbi:UvrD-helicase domain-containing protein [Plantibacter sp. ME-Dv--P-095]|uniref:HelD family protein n=1 Tax=Plantibacter sp. ME-Dv--P-095 TaxID=3040299 RepID=UPI00254DA667|nr:UvrD-helicase domain-containing protein [Plantibacter sp. ME-Dv--P-095]
MQNDAIAEEQDHLDRLHDVIRTQSDLEERRSELALRAFDGDDDSSFSERDALVAHHRQRMVELRSSSYGLLFGLLERETEERHHIGRIGLRDPESGDQLLLDWRAPASRPFYTATPLRPEGLRLRRRIGTAGRRVTEVHDEVLDTTLLSDDEPSGIGESGALLAALGRARTKHMADIVDTIQAEQDAIIRAPLPGTLLVQGGPGTGKTAVALHRAAYLLYEHRERLMRSVVLIVGPNSTFLDYISRVLPSLGETAVVLVTPATLVPGLDAHAEDSLDVAELKGQLRMADVVARAVRERRVPLDEPVTIRIAGDGPLRVTPGVLRRIKAGIERSGTPHNEAKLRFDRAVLTHLIGLEAKRDGFEPRTGEDADERRQELSEEPEVEELLDTMWPILDPAEIIDSLFTDAELLARVTPDHTDEERRLLLRAPADPDTTGDTAWADRLTPGDIALVDEAAELIGEDQRPELERQRRAAYERRHDVEYARSVLEMIGDISIDDEAQDDDYLRSAQDLADRQTIEDDRSPAERAASDRTWVYGHVIVDEAQELTPMLLRAILRRGPNRSMTLVGDINQQSTSATRSSWQELLGPQLPRWTQELLTVNYRTPEQIMELADPVRLELDPESPAPVSIRRGEEEPVQLSVGPEELAATAVRAAIDAITAHVGIAGVIAPRPLLADIDTLLADAGADRARVWSGTARESKGLEFDSVILVQPEQLGGSGRSALSLRYVALTRATQRLTVVDTPS